MAEIKNNFIKSKMNKDLDARLVPPGEYRDAQNISISKSEGDDIGALENVLGNTSLTDFGYTTAVPPLNNVDIIGEYTDIVNDRIIVFMTNNIDTSDDKLSNFASANSINSIGVLDLTTSPPTPTVVVSGRFLNFSKTHPIYGVNLVEDLLFWTDNRNQPRKININTALANTSYYTNEDNISVAKYYPYQPIDLYKYEVVGFTLTSGGTTGYYTGVSNPLFLNLYTSGGTGSGLTVDIISVSAPGGAVTSLVINNTGSGYTNGDVLTLGPKYGNATITLTVEIISTMQDVVSDFLPDGATNNPLRQPWFTGDITWSGDKEFLKEKFVRFSYRFKFDDGEYSLIAPFTQECFVPEQDGYFIGDDEDKTFKSTEVEFVRNKVNNIILILNSPISGGWDDVEDDLKVSEIDILYKQADQTTIKIVDTIKAATFSNETTSILEHEYQSKKPWKTLPTSETLRVYDQVPVRALAQETSGDRIIYGNYIDKHTPPLTLNYSLEVEDKLPESSLTPDGGAVATRKEYQNHTLKQNRTYQVGVVLSDRYGRQSTIILSELDDSLDSSTAKGSTLFNPFKGEFFSSYPPVPSPNYTSPLFTATDTWPGDSLQMTFYDIISSNKSSITGEPGLYDTTTNPLGWYSFKIVVKQQQQEYYNVYFPGILNGYISGESKDPLAASSDEPVCHIVLHSDNINKIPRDMSLLGPNQTVFRSGRPSPQDDPSYYQFVDDAGNSFAADPYTEEGERVLKERDRLRDLDSGSQITNASVKLSLRVSNTNAPPPTNLQAYPGTNTDLVTTIGTGVELGLWDPSASSPYDTAPVFYGYKNNPYIAKLMVSDDTQGATGPSPSAGKYIFAVNPSGVTAAARGTNYVAGSKNVNTNAVLAANESITGLLLDIEGVDSNNTGAGPTGTFSSTPGDFGQLIDKGCVVANKDGRGIMGVNDSLLGADVKFLVLAGDALGQVGVDITKDTWPGNMSPLLTVYEVEPIESKLDIYWETSTSGLVSDLNTQIQTSDTWTPYGFVDAPTAGKSAGDVTYAQDESFNSGDYTTAAIWPVNAADVVISGPNSSVLTGVRDGNGAQRASEFTLVNDPAGSFRIRTNAWFMYGTDGAIKERYTFYIDTTVPSETYPLDGTFITRSLILTDNICRLDNIAPTIVNCPLVPSWGVLPAETDSLVYTSIAINGSNIGGGKQKEQLTFSIVSQTLLVGPPTTPPPFYVTTTGTDGEGALRYIPSVASSWAVTIRVTDGGGLYDDCVLPTIVLTPTL